MATRNPYGTLTLNMQERLPLEQMGWAPRATLPNLAFARLGPGWSHKAAPALDPPPFCTGGEDMRERPALRQPKESKARHRVRSLYKAFQLIPQDDPPDMAPVG